MTSVRQRHNVCASACSLTVRRKSPVATGLWIGQHATRPVRLPGRVSLRFELGAGSPPCDSCDMNCDGGIDALDIEPLLDLLFAGGQPCNTCTGDVNGDGSIDALDIEPFLECLFP